MRIWFSDAREVEEMGCYIDKRGSGELLALALALAR